MKNYDVLILTDFEVGHLFPLFKLASNLQSNGFEVCFIGIADTMEIVKKNGFECFTIFNSIFPKGFVQNMKKNQLKSSSVSWNYLETLLDELAGPMKILKPKLVFSSYFLSLEALMIHYKYEVPQIIYHTLLHSLEKDSSKSLGEHTANWCYEKIKRLDEDMSNFLVDFLHNQKRPFKTIKDIVSPLKTMDHVLLCPKEFDINTSNKYNKDLYLGPCIKPTNNKKGNLLLSTLKKRAGNKIIFASMGSQTREYPKKAQRFFESILESMKIGLLNDFHLVLSLGSDMESVKYDQTPENVSVFSWVPQIEVLKKSSLAVIHGGLGSIKESIYYGVPMVIIPMGRDQVDNAQRVKHHNIGKVINIDDVNANVLNQQILGLLNNEEVNANIIRMKNIFQNAEKEQKEVELVRSFINS